MPKTLPQTKVSQGAFWEDVLVFHQGLVSKLHSVGRTDLVGRMDACHTEEFVLTCCGCHETRVVSNRCEKRWCPICVPRLARERREALEWWVAQIKQPKHVVVTARNSETLTRARVRDFRKGIYKLRKRKFAKDWKSGTWSLEVTNEGRGWHLHAHMMIDARWIDATELAKVWAKIVGQDFAIVKVKDARKADYLRELLKYVVKSSQLVSWEAQDIADFMDAFTGTRTFGVFGSLVGQRAEWKKLLREVRQRRATCKCGSCDFDIEDSRTWQLEPGHKKLMRDHTPSPPAPKASARAS